MSKNLNMKNKSRSKSKIDNSNSYTTNTTNNNNLPPKLVEIPEISYEVEKIISKEIVGGKVFYQIKWLSWSSKHNTYEPIEHLGGAKEMIEEFERNLINNIHNTNTLDDKSKKHKKEKEPLLLSDYDNKAHSTTISNDCDGNISMLRKKRNISHTSEEERSIASQTLKKYSKKQKGDLIPIV